MHWANKAGSIVVENWDFRLQQRCDDSSHRAPAIGSNIIGLNKLGIMIFWC